ncbi:MAG: hypothetical protein HN846_03325, partial [Candidatus Pacebacteria bacterium]|nr:hypothetical protein [Candidatus Paceibacterota bacterium]
MSNIAPINPSQPMPSSVPKKVDQIPTESPSKKMGRKDLSKKKMKWNYVIGGILLLLLVLGGGAGYWLTQQNQDIRQQASGGADPYCGSGYYQCNRDGGCCPIGGDSCG